MKTNHRCGKCGETLPGGQAGANLGGLCPKCIADAITVAAPDVARTKNDLARIEVERPPLKPGETFRGLDILEVIGHGGMGYVYKARQQSLNRIVALKVLSPDLVAAPAFPARFEREAKIIASLNHPNIVHVFEFGREKDVLFLTMELVDGQTLQSVFDRRVPLDVPEFLARLIQVTRGLQAIHQAGLVHRDLKPANILIAKTGTTKIADFGIAVETESPTKLTETGTFVGTPHYVSPEHVLGKKVDGRSDLYSLGVILYEGLAGRPPFDGPSSTAVLLKHAQEPAPPLHRAAPDTIPALQELVRKLLAKNPASRPESAETVTRDLEKALEGVRHPKTGSRVLSAAPLKAARPSAPTKTPVKLGIAAAAAVVFLALVFLIKAGSPPPEETPARPVVKNPAARPAPPPPPQETPVKAPAPVESEPPAPPPPAPVRPPEPAKGLDALFAAGERLLEEARKEYETAKSKGDPDGLNAAGFKVEDAKKKFQAVQELAEGEPQKQAGTRVLEVAQLAKLINDARKAATSTAPAPVPVPAPVPLEGTKAVRMAVPEASNQAEAVKLVREVFRDRYAKTAAAEQKALALELLEQGRRTKDDPAAQFVLLSEARELAVTAGEVVTAIAAVDDQSRIFDIEKAPLKTAALDKLARSAKDAAQKTALARAYCDLSEEAFKADDYEEAYRSALKAEPLAKAGREAALTAQAQELRKRSETLRTEYPKIKALLENPGSEGKEPVGRFLCFVKGDWERGLPLLAAGAAEPLKSLAALDASRPAEMARHLELGDGWWDLSEKETDEWRKGRIQARARRWYEKAMPMLSGLARLRLEKRMGIPPAAPEPGLVGYWKFDEKSGEGAFDASGEGNHGRYVNAPAPSTEAAPVKFGNPGARQFEQGRSQHLEVPNSASLQITGSLTLSAWVRPAADVMENNQGVIDKYESNGSGGYVLRLSTQRRPFFVVNSDSGGKGVSANDQPAVGVWTHVAGVYDLAGRTAKIYVGGKLSGAEGSIPPPTSCDEALWMGADYGANQFHGMIDELRIYNRALSAEEIQSLAAGSEHAVGGAGMGKAPVPKSAPSPVTPPAAPKPDKPAGDVVNPKAIAYLKSQVAALRPKEHTGRNMYEHELVLWTFVSTGVPLDDPDVQTLFKGMMERKLETTYDVALQAVILEEIDRAKYQWRIHKCAQWLIDNEGSLGRWSYGVPSIAAEQLPSGDATLTATRPLGVKSKPSRRLTVKKFNEAQPDGDNSNSAYAAMGLRACYDAGVAMPTESLALAEKWWRSCRKPGADGGWCYTNHADHKAYGSMTASAVSSLCIYGYMKGGSKGWKADRDVSEGINWLTRNYSVTYNPGPYEHANMVVNSPQQYAYYMYSLERAAVQYGTESFGANKWYPEGSKAILSLQGPDGSWTGGVADTCMAVLFLAKATRPLDPTQGGK